MNSGEDITTRLKLIDDSAQATASFTKNVGAAADSAASLGSSVASGGTSMAGLVTGLGAAAFAANIAAEAVGTFVNILGKAISAIPELAMKGAAVDDVTENFAHLTEQAGLLGSELLGSLQKGTHDTVDNFTLMKTVNQDLAAGLVMTAQQFGTLSKGAFALAQATGVNVKSALDTMNDAMLTGRTRSIALLTGKLDLKKAEEDYAHSLGSTRDHLNDEGKLEAARVAILKAVGDATERLGVQTDGLDEKVAQAQVSWENFTNELGKTIATSPVILAAFDGISKAITDTFGGSQERAVHVIAGAIDSAAISAVTFAQVAVSTGGEVVKSYFYVVKSIREVAQVLDGVALAALYVDKALINTGTLTGKSAAESTAAWNANDAAIQTLLVSVSARSEAMKQDGLNSAAVDAATTKLNATLDTLRDRMNEAKNQAAAFVGPLQQVAGAHDAVGVGARNAADMLQRSKAEIAAAAAAAKKAASDAAKFAQVLQDVTAAGGGYYNVLKLMDPAAVESAKYFLTLGASVSDVAKMHGLAKGEINAVVDSMKAEKLITEATNKVFGDYTAHLATIQTALEKVRREHDTATFSTNLNAQIAAEKESLDIHDKLSLSSHDYQLQLIKQEGQAKKDALDATGANYEEAFAAIDTVTAQKMNEVERTFNLAMHDMDFTVVTFGQSTRNIFAAIPDILIKSFEGGGGIGGAMKAIGVMAGEEFAKSLASSIKRNLADDMHGITADTMKAAAGAGVAYGIGAGTSGGSTGQQLGGALSGAVGVGMSASAAGMGIAASIGTAAITLGVSAAIIGGIMLFKKLHLSEAEKLGKDIGRDMGVNISAELAKSMEADSKKFGRQATGLLHLDEIVSAGGGLNAGNLDKFTHDLRDTFSLVSTGALTAAQATSILDKNFEDFAKAATDASGRVTPAMKEIVTLSLNMGIQSKAVTDWMIGQGANAITGFNAVVAGSAMQTADQLANLGIQAIASYTAAVAAGMAEGDALKQLAPALASLTRAYQDLGLNVDNVALSSLMMASSIAEQNPTLIAAISGLSQEMIALDNLGLLNAQTFGAMEETGTAMYARLQGAAAAAGGSTRDALGPMQGYLHAAAEQAKLLGIPLDDNTAELIRQSKELGVWKEAGLSATDKMVNGMDRLVASVQHLIDHLNGIPDVDFTVTQHNEDASDPAASSGSDTSAPGGGITVDGGANSASVLAFAARSTPTVRQANAGATGSNVVNIQALTAKQDEHTKELQRLNRYLSGSLARDLASANTDIFQKVGRR